MSADAYQYAGKQQKTNPQNKNSPVGIQSFLVLK